MLTRRFIDLCNEAYGPLASSVYPRFLFACHSNTPEDAGHGGIQRYKNKDSGDGVTSCRLFASDQGSNCSIVFEEQMI